METSESPLNKTPTTTSSVSLSHFEVDGIVSTEDIIATDLDNNATSEQVRIFVNNRGHKVKVIQIKDGIPSNSKKHFKIHFRIIIYCALNFGLLQIKLYYKYQRKY